MSLYRQICPFLSNMPCSLISLPFSRNLLHACALYILSSFTYVPFTFVIVPVPLAFTGGRGQGSTALSAQALFDIAARAQTLFDIAAQRSDPLLPLSAPPFFDISAQRSYLILDRRSALKTFISARFFMDLENFVKSRKNRKNRKKSALSAPTPFAGNAQHSDPFCCQSSALKANF